MSRYERRLAVLTRPECDRLLASEKVGRLILSENGLPVAFPVNYVYTGSGIVFRTGEGSKLSAARDEAAVAFEVDHFDVQLKTGWSVLVTGIARVLTEASEILRADQLGVDSWVPHDGRYVTLSVALVSGRRITGSHSAAVQ